MNCSDVTPLIRDYLDAELVPGLAQGVLAHLESCAECSALAAAERELKQAIRAKLRPVAAPAGLARHLRASLLSASKPRFSWRRGAVLTAVCLVVIASAWWSLSKPVPGMVRDMVEDHVRFLDLAEPAQLRTDSLPKMLRWSSGQIGRVVELPPFSSASMRLRGARLCHLAARPVALFFYEREGRRASLFVMDAADLSPGEMNPLNLSSNKGIDRYKGYQAVCWKRKGLFYALVADQDQKRLVEEVAAAYRSS